MGIWFEAQIHKDITKKYLASGLFPRSLMTFGNMGLRLFFFFFNVFIVPNLTFSCCSKLSLNSRCYLSVTCTLAKLLS